MKLKRVLANLTSLAFGVSFSFRTLPATAQITRNNDPYLTGNAWKHMLKKGKPSIFGTTISIGSNDSIITCGPGNYMVMHGKCINLTNVTNLGVKLNNSLSIQFYRTLESLEVDVVNTTCEESDNIATYNFGSNTMNFCRGEGKISKQDAIIKDKYITTIAHESWHTVQDCLVGLKLPTNKPISREVPSLWTEVVLNKLTPRQRQSIEKEYDPQSWTIEKEAYAMQKYEKTVLNVLKKCQ